MAKYNQKHTFKEGCPIKQESLNLARDVYKIEMECIREMEDYFDEEAFAKAVFCRRAM